MLTDDRRHALYRRSLAVVVVSQVFGGAGLAAGVTVGALLAQEMLGGDGLAGLPTALFTLGSALAAYLVGRLSQRAGRRLGLAAGFAAGADRRGRRRRRPRSPTARCCCSCAVRLRRRHRHQPAGPLRRHRPRAARPAGHRASASRWSPPPSARWPAPTWSEPLGGFATATRPARRWPGRSCSPPSRTGSPALVLFVLLRPDPLLVARALGAPEPVAAEHAGDARGARRGDRGVVVGATVMVLTQIAMVAIMTMTPVHMRAARPRPRVRSGFVIGIHIAAMFLPSLVTGRARRPGRPDADGGRGRGDPAAGGRRRRRSRRPTRCRC